MNINWKHHIRKIYIIIGLVLISGIILQLSRSEIALKSQENVALLEKKDVILARAEEPEAYNADEHLYCILYDSSSISLKDNAEQALEYMKKSTKTIDVELGKVNFEKCPVIILTTEHIAHIGSIDEVETYVDGGGYIFFMNLLAIDTEYNVMHRKMGISHLGEYAEAIGIQLTSNVLIGEKGLEIDDEFLMNGSYSVTLDDQVDVLAKSMNDIPLLWKNTYGEGAFMTFNGTMLGEKINRGLFTGALSLLEPDFVYSIFNSKVFYIDDFPAPIARGNNAVIFDEYQRDIPTFYQEIWWPNMLKTAKKYDIKYTGAIIESYNDRVTPPFDNTEDRDNHFLISFGRELIKSGGEVGFHGYNHQPLTFDKQVAKSYDYNVWEEQEDMVDSIEELLSYTKNSFPAYTITSYVPPSNVLSAQGREALKMAWPDLTVISSLYAEDMTGRSYIQEFEVAQDDIIEMPRITSGYFERSFDRWSQASTITGLGVFSHFVHPDDVISEDRSNDLGWQEMYEEFDGTMARVHKTYPWLRTMAATDAALDMAVNLQTQVSWTNTQKSIEGHIHNYFSEQFYIMRTEKPIVRMENCDVTKVDDDTYLIHAKASKFKIDLGEA